MAVKTLVRTGFAVMKIYPGYMPGAEAEGRGVQSGTGLKVTTGAAENVSVHGFETEMDFRRSFSKGLPSQSGS